MRRACSQGLRLLLYGLLLAGMALPPVAARATKGAAGNATESVSAPILARLVELGERYRLDGRELTLFLDLLARAEQEQLPLSPLVDKMEEGLGKRIPVPRIQQAIGHETKRLRFARDAANRTVHSWGQDPDTVDPDQIARLAKTLTMGLTRRDVTAFLDRVSPVPLARAIDALEFMAALQQARLEPEASLEITIIGLEAGFFARTAWNLPLMVQAAYDSSLPEETIRAAAVNVVSGHTSVAQAHARLGLDPAALTVGPQFASSNDGPAGPSSGIPGAASGMPPGAAAGALGPGGAVGAAAAGNPGAGSGGAAAPGSAGTSGAAPGHGIGGVPGGASGPGTGGAPGGAPGPGTGGAPGGAPGPGTGGAPGGAPGPGTGGAPGGAPGPGTGGAPGPGGGGGPGGGPGGSPR